MRHIVVSEGCREILRSFDTGFVDFKLMQINATGPLLLENLSLR